MATIPAQQQPQIENDRTNDRNNRFVQMVVGDGIVTGHSVSKTQPPITGLQSKRRSKICNACHSPPENFKTARFCVAHRHLQYICGLVGCERPVAEGSKVCSTPAHHEFYQKWLKRFGRTSIHSVRRALERREIARPPPGSNPADHLPPIPLPPLPTLPEADPVFVQTQRGEQVKHTFQAARVYCVQLLTWSCGVPVAYDKLYKSESETQVFAFLEKVWPDELAYCRPDYFAYDRACFLLRHLVTSHVESRWLRSTRFIVDAWHYIGHRVDDIVCRARCNPAPSDGSQPDLIIEETNQQGRTVQKRAFNTEMAEQLNSWFGGYKGVLNRMTDYNFDFFVYCMLFLYTEDWKYRERLEKEKQERKIARELARQEGEGRNGEVEERDASGSEGDSEGEEDTSSVERAEGGPSWQEMLMKDYNEESDSDYQDV